MKVVIPGGSGQVGTILARAFAADGHDVVVLSRRPARWSTAFRRSSAEAQAKAGTPTGCRVVPWDGQTVGAWAAELDGADAVINLAGRSVNCRYTARNRRAILDSRLRSTQAVGKAISQSAHPPRVWLQASTATIYAHRFDAPNDEATGRLGGSE